MKKILLTILLGLLPVLSFSQSTNKKLITAIIKTSAQCGDCEQRIEDALNYTKGVKYAELNLESNSVTVKFKPSKIGLEEIKAILNKTGYDADDKKAPEEFVLKLPACCQPGGMK